MAKRLHLGGMMRETPKLSLPGKLVFPRYLYLNGAGAVMWLLRAG